jgi:AcrR family transcriptional regulator
MTRRLGRPFQSDAVETRTRILREARLAFTTRGYDNTTNREISAGADITAAAIYHYFPSKVDLFVAVYDDVQTKVYDAFDVAVAQHDTFLKKFDAIFDTMLELGDEDPMLASFVVGVVTEAEHHPDLREALKQVSPRNQSFLASLCLQAQQRGELPEALPVQTAVDVIAGVIGGFARLSVTVRDRQRLRSVAKVYKNMARNALARASVSA